MLEISNLTVQYGEMHALEDVSFEVEEGEVVSIIGSNGAGKTTTLKTLCGLIRPVSGAIKFLGKEIQGFQPHEVVETGISMVPEGRQIFNRLTVYENLLLGAHLHKSKDYRMNALVRVYELFPILKERRKQYAETLSGGEQQMLAIARGLMSNPKLLCLDEPSLGLAPILIDRTFESIEKIKKEVTILLVEQNVHRALTLSDRGYVLENGRIVLSGTGKSLLQDDHVRKAYLGM